MLLKLQVLSIFLPSKSTWRMLCESAIHYRPSIIMTLYTTINLWLKGNWHAKFFFLLLPFSSRSRCLSTQEKISKLQTKYFWSYKQVKLHCLEYFLFRVWLVVMSQWEQTGRFSLTTIQNVCAHNSEVQHSNTSKICTDKQQLYLHIIVMF